jgi:hypothetical protein
VIGTAMSFKGGGAGDATGGGTGPGGGGVFMEGGFGADSALSTTKGGTGGQAQLAGGPGGDNSNATSGDGGDGGLVQVFGGAAGTSVAGTQGDGGQVKVFGGLGDVGGGVEIRGGSGATQNGVIEIGRTLTSSVEIGSSSTTSFIEVPDNTAQALRVFEGTNVYFDLDTTNGSEVVFLGSTTVPNLITALLGFQVSLGSGANPARVGIDIPDNDSTALNLNGGGQSYLDIDTTTGTEAMSFGNTTDNPTYSFAGTGTVSLTGTGQELSLSSGGAIKINERATNPTTAVNDGALFTKEVSGVTQLFYREDNNGTVHQLTPPSTGTGFWSRTGTVVYPTTTTDEVAVGAATLSGVNSEQFRVVGDVSLSSGIYFETTDLGVTGFHDIEVNACTIAGQPGDGLRVTGATTAAATGAVLGGTGGYIRMRGGVGGTQNGTNNGGGGGQMQLYGGVGGNYIGTGTERGGAGGQAVFAAGDGGECTVSTTGDAGAGGTCTVAGGDGGRSLAGNTGNCGDGGRLQLWGGSSGNDNGLDGIPGDGGDVWLQGGVGLTNGDGGDVQVRGGESFGGTHGRPLHVQYPGWQRDRQSADELPGHWSGHVQRPPGAGRAVGRPRCDRQPGKALHQGRRRWRHRAVLPVERWIDLPAHANGGLLEHGGRQPDRLHLSVWRSGR